MTKQINNAEVTLSLIIQASKVDNTIAGLLVADFSKAETLSDNGMSYLTTPLTKHLNNKLTGNISVDELKELKNAVRTKLQPTIAPKAFQTALLGKEKQKIQKLALRKFTSKDGVNDKLVGTYAYVIIIKEVTTSDFLTDLEKLLEKYNVVNSSEYLELASN